MMKKTLLGSALLALSLSGCGEGEGALNTPLDDFETGQTESGLAPSCLAGCYDPSPTYHPCMVIQSCVSSPVSDERPDTCLSFSPMTGQVYMAVCDSLSNS